jgi:hypothetical protein
MASELYKEDVRKRRLVHFLECYRATLVKHDGTTMMLFINTMEGVEAHRRSWEDDQGTEKTVTASHGAFLIIISTALISA